MSPLFLSMLEYKTGTHQYSESIPCPILPGLNKPTCLGGKSHRTNCEIRLDTEKVTNFDDKKRPAAAVHRQILNPPPGPKFLNFHAVFQKFWPNNRLAPPGKYRIHHWRPRDTTPVFRPSKWFRYTKEVAVCYTAQNSGGFRIFQVRRDINPTVGCANLLLAKFLPKTA